MRLFGHNYGFVKSRLWMSKSKSGTRLLLDFCQKVDFKVDFTRLLVELNRPWLDSTSAVGPLSQALHMNDCSPSPVQLATVFYVRSWYTYNLWVIQTANSVNLCLHVKVFQPIINHPLTSDLTHLNCINYCPMPMIHQHETHGTTKHDLINEFLRF